MQKDKTLKFWDDFYEQEASQSNATEWILQPSESILQSIANHLPNGGKHKILEIGCGNSSFSLQLWRHLQSIVNEGGKIREANVIATDVSSICIEQNLERDMRHTIQPSNNTSSGSFHYDVLNVLEAPNESLSGKHAIVLDKGCFDTFLFRSEKTKSGQHSPLIGKLLNNVHALLKPDGKYIIFSPRNKIKAIRDFNGFSAAERSRFDSKDNEIGTLDGRAVKNDVVYMHVCTKNNAYVNVKEESSFRNQMELPTDDKCCASCGVTFFDFRKGELMSGKGLMYWGRRWQGHVTHCK